MILEQVGPAACRSYLVGCEQAKRVILVDPLLEDTDRVLARLERDGLRLDLVVDTHTHADHHSGGRLVAERTGAPYALHGATECAGVDERLEDGGELEVGRVRVEVLHTPGHTPDSLTLRAGPNLLTGDFLFLAQDGAGRLDLPGGDAAAHWDSLQRLARFDDAHRVLPGHDYQGNADSTLGVERTRNPRFQNVTREEYAAWQKAIAMPTPQWMLDVIAANLGTAEAHQAHHAAPPSEQDGDADAADCGSGACAAGPLECVPLVLPEEAHRRREQPAAERPFLLDVREPWEFARPYGRHAPGAHLIPLAQLPGRLHELPDDRERELLIICKSGGRSAHAAAFLIQQGWRRVFNVALGTDGWVRAGLPVES
jgi:glyoxylase-like metal-dependent hydrolase (beta-lactamase superfamily II)/rhodanese-related sulfurtransferase